jgi:hypothetical protein
VAKAADCKSAIPGSNPGGASFFFLGLRAASSGNLGLQPSRRADIFRSLNSTGAAIRAARARLIYRLFAFGRELIRPLFVSLFDSKQFSRAAIVRRLQLFRARVKE